MENPVWNQVLAAFEAQRARNEQENDRRRREIAERYPELDALVKQRHEMIMGAVRGAFSGGQLQDAETVMAEYNKKIAAMLREKGYIAITFYFGQEGGYDEYYKVMDYIKEKRLPIMETYRQDKRNSPLALFVYKP